MKLYTSVKNAIKVADRIKSVNGLLGTPHCDYEAVRISAAWVFGSTVKGSQSPNDTDILIQLKPVGRYQCTGAMGHRDHSKGQHCNAKREPKSTQYLGLIFQRCAEREALIFIRKHIQRVSLHFYQVDNQVGDINDTKIMIYPRNDLLTLYGNT